ncbi:MAG: hypothetical protein FJ298_16100 [Planctomycetes bacterium]|nr:hypothetical protein [Planctomycetota bacterium]
MAPTIVLAATINDSHGGLAWLVEKHLLALFELFDEIFLVAPPDTNKDLLAAFTRGGCHVTQWTGKKPVCGYHIAVSKGVKAGAEHIFYIDMDRVLHWMETHPHELKKAVALAKKTDWLIGERHPEDYRAHPKAMYQTEQLPNAIISQVVGSNKTRDFLAGTFSFSRRAATLIIKKGDCDFPELFGLWPKLLSEQGFKPLFKTYRGLSWETPDRYTDEILRSGGLKKWREQYSTATEWEKRVQYMVGFVRRIL